jgi:hypothetical protein
MTFWNAVCARELLIRHSILVKQHRAALAVACIVLPALAAFTYAAAFGVNVVYWDDFRVLVNLQWAQQHGLQLGDLMTQHNEHRIPFPLAVMIASARVTHFNLKADMYLYWLCLGLTAVLLWLAFERYSGASWQSLFAFSPAMLLVFSLRQWANLLWGFQLTWGMLLLFATLALFLLQTRTRMAFSLVAAAVSAFVASFSLLAGLMIWPVGLWEIWFVGRNRCDGRSCWVRLAMWAAVGFATLAIYLHGWQPPANEPSPIAALRQPVHAIGFLLVVLGSTLASSTVDSAAAGVLFAGLMIFSAVWQMRRPDGSADTALWFGLMLFGSLAVAATTVGRWGFDITAASVPRYTVLGLLALAGLYLWSATRLHWRAPLEASVRALILAVVLVSSASAAVYGVYAGHQSMLDRQALIPVVQAFDTSSNESLALDIPISPIFVREKLTWLRQEHLNVFDAPQDLRPPPPVELPGLVPANLADGGTAPDTSYGVGLVGGTLEPKQGTMVVVDPNADPNFTVAGWASDSGLGAPGGGVYVDIDGQHDIPAAYWLSRPDLAAVFGSAYGDTGFSMSVPLRALGEGKHTISLKIVSADRTRFFQPAYQQAIVVLAPATG